MKLRHGFTLLEMIIVIAIIGFIMMAMATYLKKIADNRIRQATTNAVAEEVLSFNNFIQSHYLDIYSDDDNKIKQLINPLYDEDKESIYSQRNTNHLNDPIEKNNFITWVSEKNKELDRKYFIDKRCAKSESEISIGVNLVNDFLKCSLDDMLKNSEFILERVDLVGNRVNRDITRVDYFFTYLPSDIQKNPAEFETYTGNFIESFNQHGLNYDQATIIKRNTKSPADWELVKSKSENTALQLGDSINQLTDFQKNTVYGIRFSFYMNEGVYLKSDGSVAAEKLCWSEKNKALGPCIKPFDNKKNQLMIISGDTDKNNHAPGLCWSKNENKSVSCLGMKKDSTLDDPQLRLTEVSEDGSEKTGTLIAKMIMEEQFLKKGNDGKYKYENEYRTPVQVVYLNFTGENPPTDNPNNNGDNDGHIIFKQQECPVHPSDKNMRLYPRLTAVLSSFVSTMDESGKFEKIDLSSQSTARHNSGLSNIGMMGNIVLQVNKKNQDWVITSSTSSSNGRDFKSYINPKSLSIVALMWCDSTPQND